MRIENIALAWMALTVTPLAIALAFLAWWWCVETVLTVTGNSRKVIQWWADKSRAENVKTNLPG